MKNDNFLPIFTEINLYFSLNGPRKGAQLPLFFFGVTLNLYASDSMT